LRGLAVPDFRYGAFSVAVIQIAYPVLLLLPLLIGKGVHPGYENFGRHGTSIEQNNQGQTTNKNFL